MTAVTPPLVDEASESAAAAVLARDVNFASYFTAGLLSDRDVQLLRRYDKKDKFTQSSLLEKVRPWPLQWRNRPLALLLRRSRRSPRASAVGCRLAAHGAGNRGRRLLDQSLRLLLVFLCHGSARRGQAPCCPQSPQFSS